MSWTIAYLFQAGLLERPKRAHYQITPTGRQEASSKSKIDTEYLKKFPSFVDFINRKQTKKVAAKSSIQGLISETPDEIIESAISSHSANLESELLEKLKNIDPIRFEQIVLQLMEAMGYGIGSMTKKSHDGGIDGIIDQDELGLEKIYLQAKRYADNRVNEKEMQYFVGALAGKFHKGVFITTSCFNEKAKEKAKETKNQIIKLVDGEELVKLMIKHNIGVRIKTTIEIKKVDEDFFDD